ncbi:thiosulfate oxidation carrier protein SoxY [Sedimenticola sp.]|uniref:thiosulfate oxidation carrier protein SoxY n=1 Tax=Sedimenticola sp. TaxID=1940285 RepID=UPI003D138277
MKRRTFLGYVMASGSLLTAPLGGWLLPGQGLANTAPQQGFAIRTEAVLLRHLFGTSAIETDHRVSIELPIQVKRNSGVPVRVRCDLEGVEMIAVVSRENRYPLNTLLHLTGAAGYYNSRIRLEKSSLVSAYVLAQGRVYVAAAPVKVSIGGYGLDAA